MRKFKVNVNGTSYTVEVAEEGVVVSAPVAAAPVAAAPAAAAARHLSPLLQPLRLLPLLQWKSPPAIPPSQLRCLVK